MAASLILLAGTTVSYIASGTVFLISGMDLLELNNEPYSMSVVAAGTTLARRIF